MTSDLTSSLQWAHRANIERYERLLRTDLTDHERSFVEQRIAEERAALRRFTKPHRAPSNSALQDC